MRKATASLSSARIIIRPTEKENGLRRSGQGAKFVDNLQNRSDLWAISQIRLSVQSAPHYVGELMGGDRTAPLQARDQLGENIDTQIDNHR